ALAVFGRAGGVEQIHHQRGRHMVHDDVADPHVLDPAAAPPPGLEPDAPPRAIEDAVAHRHPADPPGGVRPEHDPAVTPSHDAVGDRHVFRRPTGTHA